MKKKIKLSRLKFLSLLFLLPGMAGLVSSAMVSAHYLQIMPRMPLVDKLRVVPRGIHGTVVYQTMEENRDLSLLEYSSVGVFLIGLSFGLVYLEKWGSLQPRDVVDDSELAKSVS